MSSKFIPIKYVNNTGKSDFQVLLFSSDTSVNTPNVYFVAWEVLRAQSSATVNYPLESEVGAKYKDEHKTITMGPFTAAAGSTWDIKQSSGLDTATLSQVFGVPANPDDAIVVRNLKPLSWTGRRFNIGLYKNGSLLSVQKDIGVKSQANFKAKPQLYFAVARNMYVGKIFSSLEISSEKQLFDLSKYPNGIVVTLNQEPDGGSYSFEATELDEDNKNGK